MDHLISIVTTIRIWIQQVQPTRKTSQCVCNTAQTGQQGPTVQDSGSTETPIAVQGPDQTRGPPS